MLRQPSVFVSHGSPMTALDAGPYFQALRGLGERSKPRAVVVVSGHWEAGPPLLVSSQNPQATIHDFYGFPRELYEVHYNPPGDPNLAREITGMFEAAGLPSALDANRGLDHGAWTPLRMMFPEANVPALQVSLPDQRTPESLFALGAMLAPLRDQGVMFLGSGGVVHNLYLPRPAENARPQQWAVDFDTWIKNSIENRDVEALYRYRTIAPYAKQAAPTTDHFDPIFVTLGAAWGRGNTVSSVEQVFEGFQYGHMSLRTFALQ